MYEKPTILDKIGKVISIAGNAILMNLCFILCSLPIVTMGQAWSGLLSAIRYNIRGDKWQDGFKAGFKTRFWRGTLTWCVMLLVDLYFMKEVIESITIKMLHPEVSIVPAISASLVFLLMTMVTFALQILNIYVPTALGDWLRTSVNMVFKVPLELAICAILFWAPYLLVFLWPQAIWYGAMVLLTAYFVLMATGATMLLKNALIKYLVEARAEGILIADDSKQKEPDEEADEETEGA